MQVKLILSLCFLVSASVSEAQFWKKDKTETTTEVKKDESKKGGSIFQKAMSKVTKLVGNLAGELGGSVAETPSLDNVEVLASVGTNIFPRDLGLATNDFLKGEWVDNGDFTMLMLSSPNGFQFFKYAGTIKLNGKELKHQSFGIHTAVEAPNSGNKKISFEKNGVEEGSFTIPPPAKNIQLLSINGAKSSINIDLTKDVVLELANYTTGPDALIRVDIVTSIIGMRSLTMAAYVKPAPKVVIPAAAFRNIETQNKGIGFKNSYLMVSDQQLVKSIAQSGVFKEPIVAVTGSNAGMWVNVTNSPEIEKGIVFSEVDKVNGSELEVSVKKLNAAYAMPLSFAKKIAVASMSIQGTTQLYESKTNNWTKTETTKSIDFPQIPEEWLQEVLAGMYAQFTQATAAVSNGQVLPENAIPSAPSYELVQDFFKDEMNTADQFLTVYKNLNPIKPLTSSSMRLFGENALLKETGADALLKVSIALQLSYDGKPAMTPYLTVEMDGVSNGGFRSFVGNTKYFSVTIKGAPYIIKKGKTLTKEEITKIVQVNDLAAAYKKALINLKEKEAAIGDYEIVWKLQQ
ncbi:MAG TPA: hypothetical protein VJA82_12385 [Sediminibacterium sp.]|jgi:hypothetical protein|uniref:hypothetical protein n=1 Tax=Sediminibacterium sp. TaxID=1917865 RepID=UPI0008B401D1|nr:hypothetical protein [Sediminibacterium sp.]OHC86473.1 MAG: hypothetical protein A2472_02595 [Sphingobacteriia bacterium RIFOXYC2_FULL_35_18]OHC89986.1 MAG: hypothetical protein A2546_11845 [Sphingobacteriia bacterium RIFOXYD2_FULL_35_12]OYZ55167.1 MAG: hypothetical protein B7Y11_02315 [Sphingobacteriia bacterium 24-36-13]OZA63185.1 MAG: hypothetical protein B7X68_11475 [Sphingobacteriia bacterium 39-36-14]HLD54097.1 hypothetical protein [Sediminibacterium sp.]